MYTIELDSPNKAIMAIKPITITPLSGHDFGATVTNVDLENLSDADFGVLHEALYNHEVLVVKSQSSLTPKGQYLLTQRFDPTASTYGHGTTLDAKRSILHPDLKTVPHQPQVQIIGNGHYDEYEGLKDFTLKHPHHKTFHETAISDEDDHDFTRFYRWHIDAALYDLNPPKVTSLLAVKVPSGRRQTLRYDDGTNETMDVPLGTTAFATGAKMYDILSEADKEFARGAKVEYMAHPFIWMSPAKSRSNGLGMLSSGLELPTEELPPIESSKIKTLPLVWKNPVTGVLSLVVAPSAIRAIIRPDGSRIDDLEEARELLYRLQRPGIKPEYVYPHDWEEGDCVLFHNRGLLHSVVGAFSKDEKRLFRQCNVASLEGVTGHDGVVYG